MSKTRTYAESRGYDSFNWWEFLDKPDKTEDEILYAVELASSWVTCAVGNQCDIIPRDESPEYSPFGMMRGTPEDPQLYQLGTDFYHGVGNESWDKAKDILAEIEHISSQIINAINNGTYRPL